MTSRDSNDKAPHRTTAERPRAESTSSPMLTRPREDGHPIVSSTQRTREVSRVLPDGARFGKYQVVRLMAKGGMSEVYEALHVSLKKGVALKVMSPELAQDSGAREAFVSEAENAARIRHPNVVDVTDVGVVDELPYLVMALLEGEDLGALYARQGRLPFRSAADLLLPVAAAVAAAHEMGIVHRDLKPENIFLHREGWRVLPKVLDFGVSFAMDTRRAKLTARVVGTPHYMSPEQALGERITARADQYALGVILYEGITGSLPRNAATSKELLSAVAFDSFPPPSSLVELPPQLEAVILRSMAREPGKRYPSMRDLALALVPFASPAARDYWRAELSLSAAERSEAVVVPPMAQPGLMQRTSGSYRMPTNPRLPSEPLPPAFIQAGGGPLPGVRQSHLTTLYEPINNNPTDMRGLLRRHGGMSWAGVMVAALLAATLPWALTRGWRRLTEHRNSAHTATSGNPTAASATEHAASFPVDVSTIPELATLILDGTPVGVGQYAARLPRDGALHELRVMADGYVTHSVWFRDQAPPSLVRLSAASPLANDEPPTTLPTAPLPKAGRVGTHARTRSRDRALPAGQGRAPALSSSDAALRSNDVLLDAPVGDDRGSLLLPDRPKVRIIDEPQPRIQLIE